ncbi:MAG: four helix bundle protein [Candidatus Paceibacterota bacterium]|jgi:hypothetical protein
MPRLERFGLGATIEKTFLDLLNTLRKAAYADTTHKLPLLEEAIDAVDCLRFFLQLAWETKTISHKHLAIIGEGIEEVGRMIGGWRKGLLTKTSTTRAEER